MKKLMSRKFLTAVSGIITGIILIIMGDVTEGVTAVISACTVYCIAEGVVDAARLKKDIDS